MAVASMPHNTWSSGLLVLYHLGNSTSLYSANKKNYFNLEILFSITLRIPLSPEPVQDAFTSRTWEELAKDYTEMPFSPSIIAAVITRARGVGVYPLIL